MTARRRPILVTGASGLLAPYIAEAARALGPVVMTARSSGDERCDLTDRGAVEALIERLRPSIVVHCAAMTNVDACEADPDAAFAANRDATAYVASALPSSCRLVYISTDQIYPDTRGPHPEDKTGPVNTYGRSKLGGEFCAVAHNATLVLRTNLFGPSRSPGRASLSDFFIAGFRSGASVKLFSDSIFSPLHMETLAETAMRCLERNIFGVFNAGSRRGMSKMDFALALGRHLGLPTTSGVPTVSRSLGARAQRTADLRMSVRRLERALGSSMPTLLQEIRKL